MRFLSHFCRARAGDVVQFGRDSATFPNSPIPCMEFRPSFETPATNSVQIVWNRGGFTLAIFIANSNATKVALKGAKNWKLNEKSSIMSKFVNCLRNKYQKQETASSYNRLSINLLIVVGRCHWGRMQWHQVLVSLWTAIKHIFVNGIVKIIAQLCCSISAKELVLVSFGCRWPGWNWIDQSFKVISLCTGNNH